MLLKKKHFKSWLFQIGFTSIVNCLHTRYETFILLLWLYPGIVILQRMNKSCNIRLKSIVSNRFNENGVKLIIRISSVWKPNIAPITIALNLVEHDSHKHIHTQTHIAINLIKLLLIEILEWFSNENKFYWSRDPWHSYGWNDASHIEKWNEFEGRRKETPERKQFMFWIKTIYGQELFNLGSTSDFWMWMKRMWMRLLKREKKNRNGLISQWDS